MKLLLGCGNKTPKGYTGVDLDKSVNPDIVDDIVKLSTIKNSTADEIKSVHSLEHLSYDNAITALKNWHRVLKNGGILSIEMPNLDNCVKMMKSKNKEERTLGTNGLFGEPGSKYLSHRFGWNKQMLTDVLKSIGFIDVKNAPLERVNKCTGKYDRDMRIIAIKK